VSADKDQDGGEDEDHGEGGEEARDDETDEIESDSDADTTKSTKRKRRKKPGRERILPSLYTDMYKVFDGSAVMALGTSSDRFHSRCLPIHNITHLFVDRDAGPGAHCVSLKSRGTRELD
jgi:hypothetical protein